MLKYFIKIVAVLVITLNIAYAQVASTSYYEYSGPIDTIVQAAWNPSLNMTTGWHVGFWGATDPAAGCNYVTDGPVTNSVYWDLVADTGISLGDPNEHFSPISNTSLCVNQNWLGFSHIHFKQVADTNGPAGVGIYTNSGPKPTDNSLAFFQPYYNGDQYGNNEYITSVSVGHVCDASMGCPQGEVFYPFSAGGSDFDKLRVAIITDQGLVQFYMANPSQEQIRQQVSFNFYNPVSNAQIQYEIQTAIQGVYSSTSTSNVGVAIDGSQGNMVYVGGVIGSAGQVSTSNGYPLWTSWGASTQQAAWAGQQTFQIEISFNQFLNGLKLATATKLGTDPSNITSNDIASIFGQNYTDPNTWTIISDSFSQEVYNPNWASQRAYVGGNMTRLVKWSINF
jgi:hypothetical protein